MKKIKLFEAFAGYGGASFGLRRSKIPFETVGFSEIDKFAIQFYKNNHPPTKNFGDITKIDPKDIPDFDLFTGGFPCQPFSQAGYKKGFSEELEKRGNMFFVIRDIISEKRPDAIFLENVRHLVNHDGGRTFTIIKDILENELEYKIVHKVVKGRGLLWFCA